jgi:hypothetical protein
MLVIVPLNGGRVQIFGTTLKNQNSVQNEITSRLNSRNACYHSVQNVLSYSMLSKSIKINTHRTIILSVVFYGHETCLLTLREEHRLRELRRIFGSKTDEIRGGVDNYKLRSLMICTLHPILFG